MKVHLARDPENQINLFVFLDQDESENAAIIVLGDHERIPHYIGDGTNLVSPDGINCDSISDAQNTSNSGFQVCGLTLTSSDRRVKRLTRNLQF